MAYTSFMRGDNTKMTNTPYTDGLIFLNTEEQALYLDDNNERIPMGGAGTGGHIIENNAGTDMTERTNLQFGGVYVSDDETNDRTKVNVTRNMSKDDFDQLTTAEKLGVIVTSNDPNDYIPFSADMVGYDNTDSGLTATNMQDAVDELNAEIVNAGTVRYNAITDRFEVLKNEVWVQSIKAYADDLILFDGTTFYVGYENGVYACISGYTVSTGFTINLPDFYAPVSGSNMYCKTFVFSDAIDFTDYSSVIMETNAGTLQIDVTNVNQNGYLCFVNERDSLSRNLFYATVSSNKTNFQQLVLNNAYYQAVGGIADSPIYFYKIYLVK